MANELLVGQDLDFSNVIKLINLPDGVNPGDAVNYGQLLAVSVDDVLFFADIASFPVTGEAGIIYIAEDTGFVYRWNGAAYVQIAAVVPTLAQTLGQGNTTGANDIIIDSGQKIQFGAATEYITDEGANVISTYADQSVWWTVGADCFAELHGDGYLKIDDISTGNSIALYTAEQQIVFSQGTGQIAIDCLGVPTVARLQLLQDADGTIALLSDILTQLLTGISFASTTPITATDNILQALGQLQAQITSNRDVSAQVRNATVNQVITSGAFQKTIFSQSIYDTDNFYDSTVYDSGTATGVHSASTIQDTSKVWTVNQYANYYVQITAGTGINQFRKIVSNTADTLTIEAPNWSTTPVSASSVYQINMRGRLTVPFTGKYSIGIRHTFSASVVGTRGVAYYVNGVFKESVFPGNVLFNIEASAFLPSKTIQLNAGDYVECACYQDSGSTLNLLATGDRNRFELVAQRGVIAS